VVAGGEPERRRDPRLGRRQAGRAGLRRGHGLRRVRGPRGPALEVAPGPGTRPRPDPWLQPTGRDGHHLRADRARLRTVVAPGSLIRVDVRRGPAGQSTT